MPSSAAESLTAALGEVADLMAADPTPPGAIPVDPARSRAIARGCIVLLAGHLERYVYACNEELVQHINASAVPGDSLPLPVRLRHTHRIIEDIGQTQWDKRKGGLEELVASDAWLWSIAATGAMEPARILEWMKSPKPKALQTYFQMWGIPDIYVSITRQPHTRADLWLRLASLVDKRNLIAHGDLSVDATPNDIRQFRDAVRAFCLRSDGVIARHVSRTMAIASPW